MSSAYKLLMGPYAETESFAQFYFRLLVFFVVFFLSSVVSGHRRDRKSTAFQPRVVIRFHWMDFRSLVICFLQTCQLIFCRRKSSAKVLRFLKFTLDESAVFFQTACRQISILPPFLEKIFTYA